MANMIAGMKVIVVHEPMPVKRTWRERLLTWPWKPFEAYRTKVHPMYDLMKGGDCYQHGNILYVSVKQFTELKTLSRPPSIFEPWMTKGA